jgi:hypothetical protein
MLVADEKLISNLTNSHGKNLVSAVGYNKETRTPTGLQDQKRVLRKLLL